MALLLKVLGQWGQAVGLEQLTVFPLLFRLLGHVENTISVVVAPLHIV